MRKSHEADDARTQELQVEKQVDSTSEQKSPEVKKSSISWISIASGLLAAVGVALVLGGVLSGALVIGNSGGGVPHSETARLLLTLTVAFLVGGYVAGRIAGRRGLKHGLLVALLSLAVTVVLGLAIGSGFAEIFNGVTVPERPDARQSLAALLSADGILVLLLSFLGAAFGGVRGAKSRRANS